MTKLLVKISKFKFLVMAEKTFVLIIFFCHQMFHSLVYFLCKICNPRKKVTTFFTSNPSLKIEILSSPNTPVFENLVGGSNPSRKGGMHTMVTLTFLCPIVGGESNCKFVGKTLKIIDIFPHVHFIDISRHPWQLGTKE